MKEKYKIKVIEGIAQYGCRQMIRALAMAGTVIDIIITMEIILYEE